jgi:hypothetical protein
MRTALVVIALGLLVCRPAGAQSGTVALLVIDDATDAAVPDVRVSIAGQRGEGVTDARGQFVLSGAKPGKVVLILRRLGYNPGSMMVDVTAGDTARVTFALTVAPRELTTVAVRDTLLTSTSPFLRDFERRVANHAGSATYIARAEIDMRRPSQTTDLLRRVSSIKIADSLGVLMAVSRRMQKPVTRRGAPGLFLDLANCPLQVAVDGQLKEWGYAVNTIAPSEIHGIEIYPGPSTIPAEYASMRRDAACGLILIWTRRDK